MTVTVVVECQSCGTETDKKLVGGIDMRNIVCPICLSNNVVFRHFYILDDTHIPRKNKRMFPCDIPSDLRLLKK